MSNEFHNPLLTVDIIIELPNGGIVLIERKNPPHGWALPGGFVDYGENLEKAAIREAKQETCLEIFLLEQFYTYSDPGRDPRHHTVSTVFIASAAQAPCAADDAKTAGVYREPARDPSRRAADRSLTYSAELFHRCANSRATLFNILQRGRVGKANMLIGAEIFARPARDLCFI